jgi:hypothetical protein
MVSVTKPVTIAVTQKAAKDLGRLVRRHKAKQADTARAYRRRHGFEDLEPAEQLRIKVAIRDAARTRREAGRLLDTRDAAVAEAVRRELTARGLDPDHLPEIPAGELEFPGRYIGTHARAVPRRVAVLLPDRLARAIQVAAWLESEPHITALRAWHRRHPEWNGLPDSVTPDALEQLRQHSRQLVTTGDVGRAALARLLQDETPADE